MAHTDKDRNNRHLKINKARLRTPTAQWKTRGQFNKTFKIVICKCISCFRTLKQWLHLQITLVKVWPQLAIYSELPRTNPTSDNKGDNKSKLNLKILCTRQIEQSLGVLWTCDLTSDNPRRLIWRWIWNKYGRETDERRWEDHWFSSISVYLSFLFDTVWNSLCFTYRFSVSCWNQQL